jgi:signal transduction histidine kinase
LCSEQNPATTIIMIAKVKNIITLSLLCVLLIQQQVFAQPGKEEIGPKYSISHYDDHNGLPQNSVKSIVQDESGFIWFATEGGLVRFEGTRFYTFNRTNLGIASNRIWYIQPAMTAPFGLLYARTNDDQHIRVKNGHVSIDTVCHLRLLGQHPDLKGAGDIDFSASALRKPTDEIREKALVIPVPGREGSYFICHRNLIEQYDNWKKLNEVKFRKADVWALFRLKKSLFLNFRDGSYSKICFQPAKSNSKNKIATRASLAGDILANPAFKAGTRPELHWNNTADQVFLSLGKSLYELSETTSDTLTTRLILEGFDFETNRIASICVDRRDQTIFLGSFIRGLFVIKKNRFQTLRSNKRADNVYYAQIGYGDGLLQTPNGHVMGMPEKETSQAIDKTIDGVRSSMLRFRIQIDKQKKVWTYRYFSIYCFKQDGRSLLKKWDFDSPITDFYLSDDGYLWITTRDNSLYRIKSWDIQPEPGLFTKLDLGKKEINYMLASDSNKLWIGTNSGLYQLNISARELSLIPGTEQYEIRNLFISPRYPSSDAVWFTSYNNGFGLFWNDSTIAFPKDRNDYLATSHYIFEDESGFFWIPTNKGLFRMKAKDLMQYAKDIKKRRKPFYLYYNTNDGLLTNEFNGGCRPCSVRLPGGFVSLPSLNGFALFSPERIGADVLDRDFFFDRLEINGLSQFVTKNNVVLPQDSRSASIIVSTPFFGNIENLDLSYALVQLGKLPMEKDWDEIDSKTGVVNLSRLNHGSYILYVRKKSGFGYQNSLQKSIILTVPPLWFQTLSFKALVILLSAVLVYWLFRMQTGRVVRRNETLEATVLERTQELKQTLVSLRQSESELSRQLQLHIRMIASITHDVRTPINYIRIASEGIETFLDSEQLPNARSMAVTIGSTSKRLFQLLDSMVAFTKSEMLENRNNMQDTHLRQLIVEKAELFLPIIKGQKGKLKIDIRAEDQVITNPKLLGVIIHNLIDNAIKVKDGNSIRISFVRSAAEIALILEDAGPGMPPDLLEWINHPLDEGSVRKPIPQNYNGLGLLMVREISSILNIRLFVEVDGGTKFHLIFCHGSGD